MRAQTPMTQPDAGGRQLKGWHVLVWFLGFFGFMFAVNGLFLWTAVATFPGEDVEKSYLTGLDYNQELARRAHQQKEGWAAEIGVTSTESELKLHVRLTTRDGNALPASATDVQLRHPADRNLDRTLALVSSGDGRFVATMPDVAAGRWTVQLGADTDPLTDGMELQASKQIVVP
jgi:nitrogen fixation protein FixH